MALLGFLPLRSLFEHSSGLRAACPVMLSIEVDEDGGLISLVFQRAVQTCCYTYRSCRDPPTAQWLSDKSGVPEMLHSIDGLPFTSHWRPWLLEQLSAQTVEIEVESVLKKHRGISPNNPFLQPSVMTYTYDVRPAEVVQRVMQAAIQISSEMAEDLGCLEAEEEGVWRNRRARVTESDDEIKNTLPAFSIDQDSSDATPFRGGTYDLMQSLATRQATKAALASLAASEKSAAAHELLQKYCDENADLFVGEIRKHAADHFLEGLLELPVTLRMNGAKDGAQGEGCSGGAPSMVDPRAICEEILEWRIAIGTQWIERLEAVPGLLLELKREHLESSSSPSILED